MSATATAVKEKQDQWVGISRAAAIMGQTVYTVQKYALAGSIRTRVAPPFKNLFNVADLEKLRRSFALE
jgi:hypothetical protein